MHYGIGKKGIDWGHSMAVKTFKDGKFNVICETSKKKFSFKEIKKTNTQSHLLGAMDFAQIALALSNEISKFKDGNGQDKFDLLVGELEILYMESVNTFKRVYGDTSMPSATIEEIKERASNWTVSISNEDTQTDEQERSHITI